MQNIYPNTSKLLGKRNQITHNTITNYIMNKQETTIKIKQATSSL